jgi:hypothetical protein
VKGKLGERWINNLLKRKFSSDHYALHTDLLIPKAQDGELTQIDHVLVSVFGIFVIETKNYSGLILGSATSRNWTISYGKTRKSSLNPILQNAAHIDALHHLLKLPKCNFHNLVALVGTAKLKEPIPGVFASGLSESIAAQNSPVLSPDQVAEISLILARVSLSKNTSAKAEHLRQVTAKQDARKHSLDPVCSKMKRPKALISSVVVMLLLGGVAYLLVSNSQPAKPQHAGSAGRLPKRELARKQPSITDGAAPEGTIHHDTARTEPSPAATGEEPPDARVENTMNAKARRNAQNVASVYAALRAAGGKLEFSSLNEVLDYLEAGAKGAGAFSDITFQLSPLSADERHRLAKFVACDPDRQELKYTHKPVAE